MLSLVFNAKGVAGLVNSSRKHKFVEDGFIKDSKKRSSTWQPILFLFFHKKHKFFIDI